MKIKFLMRREVQDENRGTPKATVFDEGSIHDLPEPSARRWLSRGEAVEVAASVAKPVVRTDKMTDQVKA